jgi:hypothetical protein
VQRGSAEKSAVGGCRDALQRCATERCFRGVLQNAMQRITVEDRCRVKCYRGNPQGRCRGALPGALQRDAAMGFCRRAMQRSAAKGHSRGVLRGVLQRNATKRRCREALLKSDAEKRCRETLQRNAAYELHCRWCLQWSAAVRARILGLTKSANIYSWVRKVAWLYLIPTYIIQENTCR